MSPAGEPLRVSLDVSAIPARAAGAGRYVLALAEQLAVDPAVDPVLLSRRDDAQRWERAGSGEVLTVAPSSRPARLLWEQVRLPRLIREVAPAVHHGPHYTMPESSPVPTVVTIHDCTFFDHPEWHQTSKAVLFRRAIRVAARRAAVLICVSRTTAEHLHRACEVRVPVVVAPHGVDHRRFAPEEPAVGADRAALAAAGLDPDWPFVAFVGTVEPRKGVPTLVEAFSRLAPGRPELRLVIAGQPGWAEKELGRAVGRSPAAERIVRLGYVSDALVPALLREAAAVAYPSAAEGYGLPALEALSCGAPLVTTSGTAMAELAGSAALLVPPGRSDALADALQSVLDEPASVRAERRRLGLRLAAEHTWERSRARHVEAYRLAAGSSPNRLE